MDQARITEIKQEWAAEATRRDANAPPAHAADLGGIPSARYASEVFYALEQQYLWPKTWLLAGTADELPGIGNFKSFDHSFAPIVLVRDKQSTIRAYFNICRHRGGALVSDPCGKISAFACRYHCWTYGLDGKLKFVPDEFDFPYLDKAGSNLIELRCETLGGLIFVNADPAAPPLQEFLTPINEEFADMNLANRRLFHKTTYDVACNWKALMDVFEEGYHISTVHPNTINQYLDSGVGTRRCYPNGHGYAYVMKRTRP
jgi:phenylpropionate dioxygenase-like ring-hydroxylating dioxygenase large terminal subunit